MRGNVSCPEPSEALMEPKPSGVLTFAAAAALDTPEFGFSGRAAYSNGALLFVDEKDRASCLRVRDSSISAVLAKRDARVARKFWDPWMEYLRGLI